MTIEELQQIYEVEEGLENRIMQFITSSSSFHEFMEKIKTKRYTWTRLQRLCLHILTNTSKDTMKTNQNNPTYIRLLGMSLLGQNYLNKTKKNIAIPIVSRLSAFTNKQIAIDINAVKVYASCLEEPYCSQMINDEFSNPPIRYDQSTRTFI